MCCLSLLSFFCEPNPALHLSPCSSCHLALAGCPWLWGLESQKLASASECWCIGQPSSWRTRAQQGPVQNEEQGGKISHVRFSRQRGCAEERDQLPKARWGASSSLGKKGVVGSNEVETVWALAVELWHWGPLRCLSHAEEKQE